MFIQLKFSFNFRLVERDSVEWRRKYKSEINDGEFPSTSTTSEMNIFP